MIFGLDSTIAFPDPRLGEDDGLFAVSGAVLRADNPADMMRRMLAADE